MRKINTNNTKKKNKKNIKVIQKNIKLDSKPIIHKKQRTNKKSVENTLLKELKGYQKKRRIQKKEVKKEVTETRKVPFVTFLTEAFEQPVTLTNVLKQKTVKQQKRPLVININENGIKASVGGMKKQMKAFKTLAAAIHYRLKNREHLNLKKRMVPIISENKNNVYSKVRVQNTFITKKQVEVYNKEHELYTLGYDLKREIIKTKVKNPVIRFSANVKSKNVFNYLYKKTTFSNLKEKRRNNMKKKKRLKQQRKKIVNFIATKKLKHTKKFKLVKLSKILLQLYKRLHLISRTSEITIIKKIKKFKLLKTKIQKIKKLKKKSKTVSLNLFRKRKNLKIKQLLKSIKKLKNFQILKTVFNVEKFSQLNTIAEMLVVIRRKKQKYAQKLEKTIKNLKQYHFTKMRQLVSNKQIQSNPVLVFSFKRKKLISQVIEHFYKLKVHKKKKQKRSVRNIKRNKYKKPNRFTKNKDDKKNIKNKRPPFVSFAQYLAKRNIQLYYPKKNFQKNFFVKQKNNTKKLPEILLPNTIILPNTVDPQYNTYITKRIFRNMTAKKKQLEEKLEEKSEIKSEEKLDDKSEVEEKSEKNDNQISLDPFMIKTNKKKTNNERDIQLQQNEQTSKVVNTLFHVIDKFTTKEVEYLKDVFQKVKYSLTILQKRRDMHLSNKLSKSARIKQSKQVLKREKKQKQKKVKELEVVENYIKKRRKYRRIRKIARMELREKDEKMVQMIEQNVISFKKKIRKNLISIVVPDLAKKTDKEFAKPYIIQIILNILKGIGEEETHFKPKSILNIYEFKKLMQPIKNTLIQHHVEARLYNNLFLKQNIGGRNKMQKELIKKKKIFADIAAKFPKERIAPKAFSIFIKEFNQKRREYKWARKDFEAMAEKHKYLLIKNNIIDNELLYSIQLPKKRIIIPTLTHIMRKIVYNRLRRYKRRRVIRKKRQKRKQMKKLLNQFKYENKQKLKERKENLKKAWLKSVGMEYIENYVPRKYRHKQNKKNNYKYKYSKKPIKQFKKNIYKTRKTLRKKGELKIPPLRMGVIRIKAKRRNMFIVISDKQTNKVTETLSARQEYYRIYRPETDNSKNRDRDVKEPVVKFKGPIGRYISTDQFRIRVFTQVLINIRRKYNHLDVEWDKRKKRKGRRGRGFLRTLVRKYWSMYARAGIFRNFSFAKNKAHGQMRLRKAKRR